MWVSMYLWQVADVNFHAAALAGTVQPLHINIQRPTDTVHRSGICQLRSIYTHDTVRYVDTVTATISRAAFKPIGIYGTVETLPFVFTKVGCFQFQRL